MASMYRREYLCMCLYQTHHYSPDPKTGTSTHATVGTSAQPSDSMAHILHHNMPPTDAQSKYTHERSGPRQARRLAQQALMEEKNRPMQRV